MKTITKSSTKTKRVTMSPTNLYSEAEKRLDELYSIRGQLKERQMNHPEGKIHVVKRKEEVQFYHRTRSDDKSGSYISKKEQQKIKALLQKDYDEKILQLINQEIKTLEKLLKLNKGIVGRIRAIFSGNPIEIKKMLTPFDMSDEDYAIMWQSDKYIGKGMDGITPQFITEKGEAVRSKSELNIANALYRMNIPYKYECPMILSNGRTIYPDFTVLDIARRRNVYWEHRGMMDDREYSKSSVQRLREYAKEDIYCGDNLIISEETSAFPLGTLEIERMIRHYFG